MLQEQNTAGFEPLGKASPRKQDLDWTLKKEKVLTSQGREESVSRRGRAQGKHGWGECSEGRSEGPGGRGAERDVSFVFILRAGGSH